MNLTKPAGHRREVHASQMTVPETPSPDVVAAKRKGRSNLGRQAGMGALKARSKQVCSPFQRVLFTREFRLMHGHANPQPSSAWSGGLFRRCTRIYTAIGLLR